MSHCKDCRNWVHEEGDATGDCFMTEAVYGGAANKDSLAIASDASGYYAILQTKPDFGCVQFAAKEPA